MNHESVRTHVDPDTSAAEQRADYRFFRTTAVYSAKLTLAGLFFIGWAALFAGANRYPVVVFLGSTTVLLLLVSLAASMTSYLLYKRRGGVIQKGPRSLEEFRAGSERAPDGQGGKDVPSHEHEAREQPHPPQNPGA